MRRALWILVACVCARGATADTLALRDGRFFDTKQIEKVEGGYLLKLENGEVKVPWKMVLTYFDEDKGFLYEPVTDLEKEKFEKGFVHYKKRWIRKSYAERLLQKEHEQRKQRVEQMKERRFWRNHAVVKTKRFEFHHTLPDDVFQEFQDLFETYYDFFTKYWGFRPSPKFGKVTINIYHDRDYFHQVSGAPAGVLGYYMPLKHDLHFFYDRNMHEFTIDVMFHEGNHMLTHMINEHMWYPWWIGEGMAEYFGASEWDPATKTMKLGKLQSGRLAVLHSQIEQEKMLKLKDLLQAERMGAVEYAWTWSFCHFLLHTPKYQKRFKKYFLAIGRNGSLKRKPRFLRMKELTRDERVDSFMKYLKVKDLEEIQKEWYDYIKNNLALDRSELDWGQAGWIMAIYGLDARARKFFKKAIDAGSEDAYVHYGYAELKMKQGMPGIALKYASKAAGFDPLHARAWALQGLALYKTDGEYKEAIRLVKLAEELDPDDIQIWYAMEQIEQAEREKKEKG